jgi:hypothetical protein
MSKPMTMFSPEVKLGIRFVFWKMKLKCLRRKADSSLLVRFQLSFSSCSTPSSGEKMTGGYGLVHQSQGLDERALADAGLANDENQVLCRYFKLLQVQHRFARQVFTLQVLDVENWVFHG